MAVAAQLLDCQLQHVGRVEQSGLPQLPTILAQYALYVATLGVDFEVLLGELLFIDACQAERLHRAVKDSSQADARAQFAQVFKAMLLQLPEDAVDQQRAGSAGQQPGAVGGQLRCRQVQCQRFERLDVNVDGCLACARHGIHPLVSDTQRRCEQPFLVQQIVLGILGPVLGRETISTRLTCNAPRAGRSNRVR